MLELLSKYKTIVSLFKINTIKPSSIISVLKLLGYKIDESIADLLVEVVKTAGTTYNTNSLYDVLTKPEIVEELTLAASTLSSAMAEHSGGPQGSERSNLLVHPDSFLKCTHCGGLNHIGTAFERSK